MPTKVYISFSIFTAKINNQVNAYQIKYDCKTPIIEISDYDNFDYRVKKSITLSSASSLLSGQNVSLRATDFIELTNGFEVPEGAELYLDVNPCEQSATPIMNKLE